MLTAYNFSDSTEIRPYVKRGDVATYHKGRIYGILGLDFKTGLLWRTGKEALENKETYYLLINLWLHLADDLSQPKFRDFVKALILKEGLLSAIKLCTKTADELRRKGVDGCYVARSLWIPRNNYEAVNSSGLWELTNVENTVLHDMLQLFDFPRRFSVENPTLLNERCINEVLAADKDAVTHCPLILASGNQLRRKPAHYAYRLKQTKKHANRFIGRFVYWLHRLLPKDNPLEGIELVHSTGSFGPGAVADSCTCTFCKQLHLKFFGWSTYSEGTLATPDFTASAITAPKSWKATRVIFPLPTVNQLEGYILKDAMDNHIAKLHLDIPGVGRVKASDVVLLNPDNTVDEKGYHNPAHIRLAKHFDEYATIDSSRASDCVLKQFIQKLSTPMSRALLRNTPTYITAGHRKAVRMNMFAPMGAVVTFPVERVVFAAITIMAYEYYHIFNPDEKLVIPWIFGDDIGCDVRVAALVMELLELFGFEPNRDKSFFSGDDYRESCGRHFAKVDGRVQDVTIMYFPRHPMNKNFCRYDSFRYEWDSRASALMAMNNRLFTNRDGAVMRYSQAYKFLNKYIKEQYPDAINTHPNMPWYREGMLMGTEVTYPYKLAPSGFPGKESPSAVLTASAPELLAMCNSPSENEVPIRVKVTCVGTRATKEAMRSKAGVKPCPHFARDQKVINEYIKELLYRDYLVAGPSFNSELDRLLGTSTRRTRGQYTTTPILDFVTKWD